MVTQTTVKRLTEAVDEIERRFAQRIYAWQPLEMSDEAAKAWLDRQGIVGEVTIIRWSRGEDADGRPT